MVDSGVSSVWYPVGWAGGAQGYGTSVSPRGGAGIGLSDGKASSVGNG